MLRTAVARPSALFASVPRAISATGSRAMAAAPAAQADEVLFETEGPLRIIKLNRPRQLHALNVSMVKKITPEVLTFESEASACQAIILTSTTPGKAYCAGGDVREMTVDYKNGGTLFGDFLLNEYRLNHIMGTLNKPLVTFWDGITMGGGVGLSVHGHFRVATENTLFAMPETGIGLFPDVGGSFFLPRLDGELGMYLGLTGARIKGSDVYMAGLATHYVPSKMLPYLQKRLGELNTSDERVIANAINEFSVSPDAFSLEQHRRAIDRCFGQRSVEAIFKALEQEKSEWADRTLAGLRKQSPNSLKVTFEQIRRGRSLTFEECFTMERRLGIRMMTDSKDFVEGVRALLIDKDNKPQWTPSTVEQVSLDWVAKVFEPITLERDNTTEQTFIHPASGAHELHPFTGLPTEKYILDTIVRHNNITIDGLREHLYEKFGQKFGLDDKVDALVARSLIIRADKTLAYNSARKL